MYNIHRTELIPFENVLLRVVLKSHEAKEPH
jgi:hypothetical protein